MECHNQVTNVICQTDAFASSYALSHIKGDLAMLEKAHAKNDAMYQALI